MKIPQVAKILGPISAKSTNGKPAVLKILQPLAGGHAHLEQEQAQGALKQADGTGRRPPS